MYCIVVYLWYTVVKITGFLSSEIRSMLIYFERRLSGSHLVLQCTHHFQVSSLNIRQKNN